MAGRKRKGERRSPLEECHGRWRIDYKPLLEILKRNWPQALGRVVEELESLAEALNRDRGAIGRLLREPVVAETALGPVRRYRVSTPAGWLRVLFFVDVSSCTVVFADAELRDEETYRRVKRRLR